MRCCWAEFHKLHQNKRTNPVLNTYEVGLPTHRGWAFHYCTKYVIAQNNTWMLCWFSKCRHCAAVRGCPSIRWVEIAQKQENKMISLALESNTCILSTVDVALTRADRSQNIPKTWNHQMRMILMFILQRHYMVSRNVQQKIIAESVKSINSIYIWGLFPSQANDATWKLSNKNHLSRSQ